MENFCAQPTPAAILWWLITPESIFSKKEEVLARFPGLRSRLRSPQPFHNNAGIAFFLCLQRCSEHFELRQPDAQFVPGSE